MSRARIHALLLACCFTGLAACGGDDDDAPAVDATPQPDAVNFDGAAGVATDCAALSSGTPSGTQTIDPDGPGGDEPFDTWCEMDFDGGGWTLLAVINNNDASAMWADPATWSSPSTFGAIDATDFGDDFKSPGWATMPWEQIYLLADNDGWKMTGAGAHAGASLRELFSSGTQSSLTGTESGWEVNVGTLTIDRDAVFFAEIQNPADTLLVNLSERNRCVLATAYDGYDVGGGTEDQVEGYGCTAGFDPSIECDNNACGETSHERSLRIYVR